MIGRDSLFNFDFNSPKNRIVNQINRRDADFTDCFESSNRPTIAQFNRRDTVRRTSIMEDSHESCESISNRASELEGTINMPYVHVTKI